MTDSPGIVVGAMLHAIQQLSAFGSIPIEPTDDELFRLPFDTIKLNDRLNFLPPPDSIKHAALVTYYAEHMFPESDDRIKSYTTHRDRVIQWLHLANRHGERQWRKLAEEQGRWDPKTKPIALSGPDVVPTPFTPIRLGLHKPLLTHLESNGTHTATLESLGSGFCETVCEPLTGVRGLQFQTAIIYADQRLEMRKAAVGPEHIDALMKSLDKSAFVKHVLLANNWIDAQAVHSIAEFVRANPSKIESWYLEKNFIDGLALSELASSMVKSDAVTHVWLQRNPLDSKGKDTADSLFKLIAHAPNLRFLDLTFTKLGNNRVTTLFDRLASLKSDIGLETLRLSINGIRVGGARAIGACLASTHCKITALDLSGNAMGDVGIQALCLGLRHNSTIQHLALRSTGITAAAIKHLVDVLVTKEEFRSLDLGMNRDGNYLDQAFNFLDNDSGPHICRLLSLPFKIEELKFTALGMDMPTLRSILKVASQSQGLLDFQAIAPTTFDRRTDNETIRLERELEACMDANLQSKFGEEMTYETWRVDKHRWSSSGQNNVSTVMGIYLQERMNRAKQRLGRKRVAQKNHDTARDRVDELMTD